MKIGIKDDQPALEIESPTGNPKGPTKQIIELLNQEGFKVSLSGVSQTRGVRNGYDFDFSVIEPGATPSSTTHDALLCDYTLQGHNPNDNSGLAFAEACVAAGIPAWRIAFFSRHGGRHFVGKTWLDYPVFDKTIEEQMVRLKDWLLNLLNAPSRKSVPSSALCGLLKPNNSLIDRAFHGTLKAADLSEANPMDAFRGVLDCQIFPEVEILAGQNGEKGINAVWESRIASDALHAYWPAAKTDADPVWDKIKKLINCHAVTENAALRGLRLLDWLFPRPAHQDEKTFVEAILKQSCSEHQPHNQSFEILQTADWIAGTQPYAGHLRVPVSCWRDFLDTHLIANSAKSAARTWKVGLFSGNANAGPVFVVIECHGSGYLNEIAFLKCVGKVFRNTRSYCHIFAGARLGGKSHVVELLPDGHNPKERRIASEVVHYKGHQIDFTFRGADTPSSAYVWIVDIEQ